MGLLRQGRGKAQDSLARNALQPPVKKLGIPDANLHTWRHTFASYLTMRTGNKRPEMGAKLGAVAVLPGRSVAQVNKKKIGGR